MSSSKPSPKKIVVKPKVTVPAAAAPKKASKEVAPASEKKKVKPVIVVPAPKASTKPIVKVPLKTEKPTAKPVVDAKPKAPAKPIPEAKPKVADKAPAKAEKETKVQVDTKAAAKVPEAPKRRIDTPEIQEKIRELIKLAKEQDYLTYDDINEILPNDLVDPDDVEAIMERLRNMEFDIIDASEVDRYKDKKRDEGDGDEEDVKADQKLDILDDPVRMYLKQMGQVPLLTREQEVEARGFAAVGIGALGLEQVAAVSVCAAQTGQHAGQHAFFADDQMLDAVAPFDADGAVAELRLQIVLPEVGGLHDMGIAIDDESHAAGPRALLGGKSGHAARGFVNEASRDGSPARPMPRWPGRRRGP